MSEGEQGKPNGLKMTFFTGFIIHGTHCTGKTGKITKRNPCQGKHRELGKIAKSQGIWFAQVVNSLMLIDISVFAAKFSQNFF